MTRRTTVQSRTIVGCGGSPGVGAGFPPARLAAALLAGTVLAGAPAAAYAQPVTPAAEAPASDLPAPLVAPPQVIQSITVSGAQRLEPDTIRSYVQIRPGEVYSQALADQALKDLYATELFSEVQIRNDNGVVVIEVKENPVINRVILEGNKKLKDEKITPEIKLAPRQIFTRSKVRADVARIIELYKRQGRFAATVEPKMVALDQNRVDIVFEIQEGPKSKVRQINIIGNEKFSDGELRGEMVTKQARLTRFFSSNTGYDPDRLAFDQQKLRQFYLTKGYADFRVVSAVAELTPDKEDFIITYVVEEGQRYKFGEVKVDSQLREFDGEQVAGRLPMKSGDWYDAKLVEDTVERLSESVGTFGYAFADVRPMFQRSREDLTMGITFVLNETPRVYVERVDVNGNTLTQDKVVRREFRLSEGDAFNSLQVKRSTNRINSLGYFQDKFEVEQKPGSAPDRIVLEANVEEKATGELQLSAGFSSLESFILQASIRQRNFRGRGQTVGASVNYSRYSKSAEVSFTEPYVFDRNVSAGLDIYRRDLNNFNFANNDRNTTFEQTTTGFQGRLGVPLTEFVTAVGRYTFNIDDVTLDRNQFFADLDGDGTLECNPLAAGRYLCDAIGNRTSSILGLSLVYDTLDNRLRPTRGNNAVLSLDFAGLGGSVKYARARLNAAKYWPVGGGFIFSVSGEGGIIKSLQNRGSSAAGVDDIRLTDRFYLGEPQIRGFDIRGVGPRVLRIPYISDSNADGVPDVLSTDRKQFTDDALGGKYYYLAHAELEIPLGSGVRELGLRPSVFIDAGALFGVTRPVLLDLPSISTFAVTCNGAVSTVVSSTAPPLPTNCAAAGDNVSAPIGTSNGFREVFLGDSPKPRLSVGIGVNWNSPFGPFRIDVARALLKEDGDDTKLFTFNVGTQF
ncbi:MAG: outer membrane protein assembly factor BamA [Novosphingobium sp.]